MRKLLAILLLMLGTSSVMALEFDGDVPKMVLRKLLLQGKAEYNGKKIVISKDAKVPDSFQKKWDEKKLSGETVPAVGEPGANVIFVKSF